MAMTASLDPRYTGPLVIESYLKKLKKASHRAVFSSKFTKRWFVLDLRSGSFHYLQNKNKTKPERAYTLSDILSVDINPKVIEVCDWKFSFVVETNDRSYFLYAESVSMHTLWCTALLALVRIPVGEPQQPNERPAYEHYQDRGQPQDPREGYPRRQDYDPEARTPSPMQDSRYPPYPPPPPQGLPPNQQAEYKDPEALPPPEQSQEAPEEPPIEESREQPRAPPQQAEPRERPQVPEGTFVRVMEEAPQAAPRAKAAESQPPANDEFEIQTPSRFSEGRTGPVVGEGSYQRPERQVRSIWTDSPVETEGVIKVEKMMAPDGNAKDEVRNIRRERLVKKEEKPKEEPRPPPKVEAKPRPQPQPRPEAAPAALKESLNLGKGGFTDMLDEMHNLSLPPADDMPKSIWGGAAKVPKEKKAKEQPAPVYRPEPAKASNAFYEPAKVPAPIYEPARAQAPPSYEPVPSYKQVPEVPMSRPTYDPNPGRDSRPAYESDSRREAKPYNPQPPVYQEAPRQAHEVPRTAYVPPPVYSGKYSGEVYVEKPAVAAEPQNYDDWDDEPANHQHSGPPADPQPQKKQGLNWDDWDQE